MMPDPTHGIALPRRGAQLRPAIVLLVLLFGPAPILLADPVVAARINFKELLHFALLNYAVRFESTRAIEAQWAGNYDDIAVVNVSRTSNRYLLTTNNSTRVQEIVVRGTSNMRNLLYDLRFFKTLDPNLGIYVHRGFDLMATALYDDVLPRLIKGYSLRLSGQSLGAAEALLLAMRLSKQGWDVDKIVTFGQPKVTDAEGAAMYEKLPLIRVVDQNDVVPLLPPANMVYADNPYVHFGREVTLLEGPYYCTSDSPIDSIALPSGLTAKLDLSTLRILLREHSIRSYVQAIRDKEHPIEVPCSARERYVSPAFRY